MKLDWANLVGNVTTRAKWSVEKCEKNFEFEEFLFEIFAETVEGGVWRSMQILSDARGEGAFGWHVLGCL